MKEIQSNLRNKDLVLDGNLIMLTGNFILLDNHSGYALETEYPNPRFSENNHIIKDILFENYIVVPMSKLNNFIEKQRSEGFISNSCTGSFESFKNKIELLEKRYKKYFIKYESCFDVQGGITINTAEEAFVLNKAKKVKILENLLVKRLKLSEQVVDALLKDESDAKGFFKNIEKEMKGLGCTGYTIVPPIIFNDFDKYAEIRIYGRV